MPDPAETETRAVAFALSEAVNELAEARAEAQGLQILAELQDARLAAIAHECDKAEDRWRAGVGALVPLLEVATVRAALRGAE